jgi:hypothetical protein
MPDLAKLIQQVMTHPDVPDELYNGLSEGLSEITWRGNGKAHDLNHIRSCLATISVGVNSTAADQPADEKDGRIDHVSARMTYREARVIVEPLTHREWDDNDLGDLLALMHGLTYNEHMVDREGILYEVKCALMTSLDHAQDSVDKLVMQRIGADRTEAE